MSTVKSDRNFAQVTKFKKELESIWKDIDLSSYPEPTSPSIQSKHDVSTHAINNEGSVVTKEVSKSTQLLSMDQFLPDSAPCSSYGCGDAKSGLDSAEKVRYSYGEALHLPYSNNSVGMNHSDQVYH